MDCKYYDYVVIGCCGVGSAALYRLAKRAQGNSVLGLEQFSLGHHNGGSQDVSRAIRYVGYAPPYMPLVFGSYEAWAEVEEESGIQLVHKCGSLQLAEKNTDNEVYLEENGRTLKNAGIKYEILEGTDIHRRFPSFPLKPDFVGLYQADGGLVDAALANAVHIQLARKYGADVLEHTTVKEISRTSKGNLQISTNHGDFTCKKVIVTAGAWINDVITSVGVHVPVTVTQEQATYFGTPNMKEFSHKRFPVVAYQKGEKLFYTMPIYCNSGFKAAIDASGKEVTPDTRTYDPDATSVDEIRSILNDILPRAIGPILYTKTCLYTMTSDREFVIDTAHRTGFPDVIICCGAGHIFKFAAVVGKILTSLALDQDVEYDISRFRLDRPAITDPHFQKCFHVLKAGVNDKGLEL